MSVTRESERTDYLYRKGKYLYFRMADGDLVALPPDTSSAEFRRAYDACLLRRKRVADETPSPQKPRGRPAVQVLPATQGTVGQAILVYKRSAHYTQEIRASSRAMYEIALADMNERIGGTALADFADVDAIDAYAEEVSIIQWKMKPVRGTMKRVKTGGRSTAGRHIILLAEVWRACRRYPEFGIKKIPNPFREAERPYKKAKHPALPWSETEQDKFTAYSPSYLVLGFMMLKFFGQRGSDAVKVQWTEFVERRNDFIDPPQMRWGILVAPQKGDDLEPEFLELPQVLVTAILEARKERTADTILVNRWGKPWASAQTLSQSIRLQLIKLGLAARFTKTISMHGLRKNAAIMAADTDFGVDGIKTVTLHRSDDMANYYAAKRNKEKLRSKVIARINEMQEQERTERIERRRAALHRVK